MPVADLSSLIQIKKIKHPSSGTIFYSHDGKGYKGLRLSVGVETKTWVLSKRIGASVKSIKLGAYPDVRHGDDAMVLAKEKLDSIEAGTDARSTEIKTLRDAFDSHLTQSTASKSTKDTYEIEIETHLKALFNKDIEKVTVPMLEAALAEIVQKGKFSTADHCCNIIKMAFARAARVRRIPNLADGLKVKAANRPPVRNKVLFDVKETWPAISLINEIESQSRRIGWVVMLFTGIRSGAVKSLDWSQIDLKKKTITLHKMKNGLSRTLPVADVVIDALKALPHRTGWVFPANSESGHTEDFGALKRGTEMFKGKERDKIVLRQHDTRRLFTTAGRGARLPTYVIDELRGDTAKTTQDGYDQGSATHEDANAIAARLIHENKEVPVFALDKVNKPS